jgi:bacteriorhodopsin
MTVGASLAVIIVGILLAALVHSTLGWIVVAIGVIGLIISLVSTSRTRSY